MEANEPTKEIDTIFPKLGCKTEKKRKREEKQDSKERPEKRRRRNKKGTCFYCNKKHYERDCPINDPTCQRSGYYNNSRYLYLIKLSREILILYY